MADTEQYNKTTTTQTITSTPNVEPYQAATLPSYQAQTDAVNNQYDAAINSQKTALENAYNLNKTQMERDMAKIPEAYDSALNNQASQYERQRMAYNEQAAANGVGTGTASQAQLAMNVANQGNMASINKAKADAITDAQNKITDLHTTYQNSVAEAVAQNDYERAVQMLNEYRTQAQSVVSTAQAQADEDYRAYQSSLNANNTTYQRSMEQAKLLAQYGDFSGYEQLYGANTAKSMKQAWIASNPNLAYNTGAISASRYRDITGRYPAGYAVPGTENEVTTTAYYGGGGGSGTTNYKTVGEAYKAVVNGTAPSNYTIGGKAVSDTTAGRIAVAASNYSNSPSVARTGTVSDSFYN